MAVLVLASASAAACGGDGEANPNGGAPSPSSLVDASATAPPPAPPPDAGGALATSGFGPAAAEGDTLTAGNVTATHLSFGSATACTGGLCVTGGFAR